MHKIKLKNKSRGKSEPQNASMPSLVMSEEAMESFEAELCWCIKQLQNGLQLSKLNSKQIQDHTKSLNSLMSKTTSIIKKRQIMRLSFGDYRSKMADDDRKYSKMNQSAKVHTMKPSLKSKFIKKSVTIHASEGIDLNNTKASSDFKFNFNIPT